MPRPQPTRTLEPPVDVKRPTEADIDKMTRDTTSGDPEPQIGDLEEEQEQHNDSNTLGAPEKVTKVPLAETAAITPAVGPRGLQVPVESNEQFVAVRPVTTFSCTIGNARWDFKKGEIVRVPLSVKEVLAHANKIFP